MEELNLEKEKIKIEDVYVAMIVFGSKTVQKTILAKSESEAIETIEMYYDDPATIAVAKLNDVIELLDSTQNETNPIIVMEMKPAENGELTMETTKFLDKSMDELQQEYRQKEAMFFNKESLVGLLSMAMSNLENSTDALMLSDSYLV